MFLEIGIIRGMKRNIGGHTWAMLLAVGHTVPKVYVLREKDRLGSENPKIRTSVHELAMLLEEEK
jgi:hypothetical protein